MAFRHLPLALFGALIGVAAAMLALVANLAADRVQTAIEREAGQSAGLLSALLRSEVEHYQALPVTLASDSAVAGALRVDDRAAVAGLNERLALISEQIGSAAIYLVRADGRTIAASNAATPGSFVGNDYRFRDYFRDAMRNRRAYQFALGTTTRRPGLYIAQRVDAGARALGVVVVKVEFERLETEWQRSGTSAFVTDRRGVVIITSNPAWRFRPMTAFLSGNSDARVSLSGNRGSIIFIRGRAATVVPGWTVHALAPAEARINDAIAAALALAASSMALLGGLILWLWLRQRRTRARQLADEQAVQILEQRVEQRTAELSKANVQLVEVMHERRRAEVATRILHEELEQANRLATLGQIAAGVTHEINQPVAAIRATADNALTMLARGQHAPARTALGKIAKLTERIGAITGELRAFSAKRNSQPRPLSVDAAIDGALTLVGTGLRQAGIVLDRPPRNPAVKILADKIRIEQILVNLLRNALEAIENVPDPRIVIDVSYSDTRVDIRVSDNGPGIGAAVAAHLFTPFRTTKDQGLGLGLVISRDIAASLGGELNLLSATTITVIDQAMGASPLSGATFQLLMPRAT